MTLVGEEEEGAEDVVVGANDGGAIGGTNVDRLLSTRNERNNTIRNSSEAAVGIDCRTPLMLFVRQRRTMRNAVDDESSNSDQVSGRLCARKT